jgi:outer membrane protein, adhesin transport system
LAFAIATLYFGLHPYCNLTIRRIFAMNRFFRHSVASLTATAFAVMCLTAQAADQDAAEDKTTIRSMIRDLLGLEPSVEENTAGIPAAMAPVEPAQAMPSESTAAVATVAPTEPTSNTIGEKVRSYLGMDSANSKTVDTPAPVAEVAATPTFAVGSLADSAQKAISTNPEVTARMNALRAAANEIGVAQGAYLPQVNLSGDIGKGSDSIRNRSPERVNTSQQGIRLGVNQLLWNGLATKREVARLGHARLTRYFEFINTTEETALEASRAHIDVLRYRKLVELAEDNYVQHKYAFDQLSSKVKAGVGRGVDSEQANARLALAESNLTTEVANLHDVSARYMRIVGEAPTATILPANALEANPKATTIDAVSQALSRNASISAAVENLRSVEQSAKERDSAFQPTVQARASTAAGRNLDGTAGQRRDSLGEIVLNWNLYNGGSDQARVRQYADLVNQAADLRDKACRDVRQTTAIAHNDIQKLKDQLASLDRNTQAIQKARDAYRQQFDIGQRSLLDLLNSENELYTAKRAYANAEHDLFLAYARTHASTNSLVSTLGLSRTDDGSAELVSNWQAAEEAAQRCPVSAVTVASTSKADLDARARNMTPTAKPAPSMVADVPKVEQRLRDWVAAWMSKDISRYMTFYAKEFSPSLMTWGKWTAERARLVGKKGPINIKLDNIKAYEQGDFVVTSFVQDYKSDDYKDISQKTLTWRLVNGQWIIFKESNR